MNKILIRNTANSINELYDSTNGRFLYFRGANYFRMTPVGVINNFDIGLYDHTRSELALQRMSQLRYNTVRIAINPKQVYLNGAFNQDYLNNFKDFLNLCEQYKIYALVLVAYMPPEYQPLTHPDFVTSGNSFNKWFMTPNYPEAKALYLKDLFSQLDIENESMNVVMGWQLENEPFYDYSTAPFTLNTNVTPANGLSYNPSVQIERLQLMNHSTVYYTAAVVNEIKSLFPNALLSMAVQPPADGLLSNRVFNTSVLFNNTSLDFVSLNIYPNPNSPNTTNVNFDSLGIDTSLKPIIISEYGAYPVIFGSISQGLNAMLSFQKNTASQYKVQGWLYYDYDTWEIESYLRIYHSIEKNGDETLNIGLSPAYRPDPTGTLSGVSMFGKLDGVSASGNVVGWVYDCEAENVKINFWLDGTANPNQKIGTFTTGSIERPDVNKLYRFIPSNVGFEFQIPNYVMRDGKSHVLYVWAVDKTITGATTSYLVGQINVPKYR